MRSVFGGKIDKFNKILPLAEFLVPLVGEKKEVRILDLGCGPFNIIGSVQEGVKVDLTRADKTAFEEEWTRHNAVPIFPIEVQNMEKLTYLDDSFDIVVCINALDHTKDAPSAIEEMVRVCKPGGWIYIDCALDQRSTTGGWHYWDAKEDGMFIGRNNYTFDIKKFGFQVEYLDNGGPRRHNHIVCKLQKC